MDQNLIFDVGMNHGEDTEFYLSKGFRVVAVEANPVLVEKAYAKFKAEIESESLTVCGVGIAEQPGVIPFYVNLSNDHWSSFDAQYGCREDTPFEVVNVECVNIATLVQQHGLPRYMKIDVEGIDRTILQGLCAAGMKPSFVSVEEYGAQAFSDMRQIGYDRFFLARQNKKFAQVPEPALEGKYVAREFSGKDSGLFGLELPGPWLSADDAIAIYHQFVRRPDGTYIGPAEEWFDIHATTVAMLKAA